MAHTLPDTRHLGGAGKEAIRHGSSSEKLPKAGIWHI